MGRHASSSWRHLCLSACLVGLGLAPCPLTPFSGCPSFLHSCCSFTPSRMLLLHRLLFAISPLISCTSSPTLRPSTAPPPHVHLAAPYWSAMSGMMATCMSRLFNCLVRITSIAYICMSAIPCILQLRPTQLRLAAFTVGSVSITVSRLCSVVSRLLVQRL